MICQKFSFNPIKYLQLNTTAIISKHIRYVSQPLIHMKANPKHYDMMPKKQGSAANFK
jgi:hypothetical protein